MAGPGAPGAPPRALIIARSQLTGAKDAPLRAAFPAKALNLAPRFDRQKVPHGENNNGQNIAFRILSLHRNVGDAMNQKKVSLISLASALAALAPAAQASVPTGTTTPDYPAKPDHDMSVRQPNTFYNLGEDLMGLVTSTAKDGTLIAEHYSHSSHASHASHYSGG